MPAAAPDPLAENLIADRAKAGRGAAGNPAGRYERYAGQAIDDGWLRELTEEDPDEEKIPTQLHIDTTRTIINRIDSPDLPYMRSINPYRGCEHGCIYCYARPSHSWLGYSAGLDFETQIFYKPDAAALLRAELAAKNYDPEPVTLGSNTDCYQPAERRLKITRSILEVLHVCDHPLAIITKSALVARDIDLLAPMAQKNLAHVSVSLTTLDPALARVMEPRAAAPWKRLATIKALAEAGIPVTVMTAPLIPGLNDMEMERLLEAAWEAGARAAHYTLVRLPYELKDLFRQWLETHRPGRAEHVLSLIRETRGGKLYDADYSQRRRGSGVYSDLIASRFTLAKKRLGFDREKRYLDKSRFRPPERNGQMGFTFA
ncbi:MAG TPA: PA0069 family radical SAM protein [Alphaproteobacteria bacterium]|nr:PA0069 family radical SAM protein [Alphaproteobacteria bacterium]